MKILWPCHVPTRNIKDLGTPKPCMLKTAHFFRTYPGNQTLSVLESVGQLHWSKEVSKGRQSNRGFQENFGEHVSGGISEKIQDKSLEAPPNESWEENLKECRSELWRELQRKSLKEYLKESWEGCLKEFQEESKEKSWNILLKKFWEIQWKNPGRSP